MAPLTLPPCLPPSLPPSPGAGASSPHSPAFAAAALSCDAQTLVADSDFWERYSELRPLGRGCFGTVMLVRERGGAAGDAGTSTAPLAAKVVVTDDAAHALNEATLLRSLDHPHIVSLHDVYASASTIFVLMGAELGGDLCSRAEAAPGGVLTEADALAPLAGVLSALDYLHSRHQIVHRDVKASNVLLAADGRTAKLGDFGLAAKLPDSGRLTSVCGTHDFLAPEMIRTGHGECDGYGASVDLWAVGLMLHGLLFGTNPFERDTDIATLQAILAGDYQPPPAAAAPAAAPADGAVFSPAVADIVSPAAGARIGSAASAEVRDLLAALLVIEPSERATAAEAHERVCRMRDALTSEAWWMKGRLWKALFSRAG